MRALIFSDSHGNDMNLRWMLEQVWKYHGPIDYYLHCGDGAMDFLRLDGFITNRDPLAAQAGVAGNCDFGMKDVPLRRVIPFGSHTIFLTHGHYYGVKGGLDTVDDAAVGFGCDITVFGHTHVQHSEQRRTLLINPGSVMNDCCAMLTDENGRLNVNLMRL